MTRTERYAAQRRLLIHAAVFHADEFIVKAVPDLVTLAVTGSDPLYGAFGPTACAEYLRRAVAALPVHEGCCDAG